MTFISISTSALQVHQISICLKGGIMGDLQTIHYSRKTWNPKAILQHACTRLHTHIFYINLSFINILQKLLHQFLAQQATAQVLCFWCFYQQLSMLSMETKTAEAKCKALLKTHKQELWCNYTANFTQKA